MVVRKCVALLVIGFCGIAFAGEPDAEGCQDPPLVSRMPGYHIYSCENLEFGADKFFDKGKKETTVEGRIQRIMYYLDSGARTPSALQITRNYENALKRIGGTLLSSFEDGGGQISTTRLATSGSEYWVEVQSYNPEQYSLKLVQKAAMAQDVAANADALKTGLAANGHAEVPGIYFDTGKSTLKPESDASLSEISKLLAREPRLKIYVVGHTDNVGGLTPNMTLSSARAEAVVSALVGKYRVDARRLAPFGNGPYSPVASNATEEGRAKNRRVELVAQ